MLRDGVRIPTMRFEPSVVFHITDIEAWQAFGQQESVVLCGRRSPCASASMPSWRRNSDSSVEWSCALRGTSWLRLGSRALLSKDGCRRALARCLPPLLLTRSWRSSARGGGGGGSGAGGRRFTGWSGICLSFLGTKNARACKRWLSSFSPEFSDDSYLTILVRLLMLVLPHIKDLVEKMVR